MRESTNRSRSWRVRLNFLARLKHKFNKKVDKYFVSHYFPDETAAAAPPHPWSGGHDVQFQYHNEASSSNHTSGPNSQTYFDATDTPEYLQQHQRASELQGHLIPPSSAYCNMGASFPGDAETPMSVTEYDLAEFSDAIMEMQLDSHHPIYLQQDNQYGLQQDLSHLHQDIHLHQQDTNLHGHQHFFTAPSPAPSASIHEMSTDTAETADSNMTDTGNSTFTGRGKSTFAGSSYILPPHPVHLRRTAIRKFLTVHDVTRILFDEDAEKSTRSKFRVVASIVYAYRKFKALLKRKQPSTPTTSMISRRSRIRSLHSSRVYQGIKQRKGKWVAEIRVSRMPDKVWLGSFPLEKQAALAYDLGLHHCSVKRNKVFNFRESPLRLGPSQYAELLAMSKEERKVTVQSMACEYAMAFGGS